MNHITGNCLICNKKGMSCMEEESKTCPNFKLMDVRESSGPPSPKDFTPDPPKQVDYKNYKTTE